MFAGINGTFPTPVLRILDGMAIDMCCSYNFYAVFNADFNRSFYVYIFIHIHAKFIQVLNFYVQFVSDLFSIKYRKYSKIYAT
jgi:hypothetical protein